MGLSPDAVRLRKQRATAQKPQNDRRPILFALIVTSAWFAHSLVDRGQPRPVIGDVDGEQTCRLGCAGVLAEQMLAARRLEEALARPVHLGRAGRGILRADRPRST